MAELENHLKIKDEIISQQCCQIEKLQKKIYVSGCIGCGKEFRDKVASELYEIKQQIEEFNVEKNHVNNVLPLDALICEINKSDSDINVNLCQNILEQHSNLWRQRPFNNQVTLLEYLCNQCNENTVNLVKIIKTIFDSQIDFNIHLKKFTKSEFIMLFIMAARAGLPQYIAKMIDFVKDTQPRPSDENGFIFSLQKLSDNRFSNNIDTLSLKGLINGKNRLNASCLYSAACIDCKYEHSEKICYFLIEKFGDCINIDIYSIAALGLFDRLKQYIDNLYSKFENTVKRIDKNNNKKKNKDTNENNIKGKQQVKLTNGNIGDDNNSDNDNNKTDNLDNNVARNKNNKNNNKQHNQNKNQNKKNKKNKKNKQNKHNKNNHMKHKQHKNNKHQNKNNKNKNQNKNQNKNKSNGNKTSTNNGNTSNNCNSNGKRLYVKESGILKLLEDDIFLLDPHGMTCLHWLVRPRTLIATQNCYKSVEMLLNFYKEIGNMIGIGNDILYSIINHPNNSEFGMFAIHHACHWQIESKNDKNIIYQASIDVIQLLLDNGANINEMAKYGRWTPLDYAMDQTKDNLVKFLKNNGAMTSNKLHGITDSDDEDDDDNYVMNAEDGDPVTADCGVLYGQSEDQKSLER